MRNIDDRHPGIAQFADDRKQLLHLAEGKRSGRLVQNQNLRLAVQRFQDLDLLAFRRSQVRHDRVRLEHEAVTVDHIIGFAVHRPGIEHLDEPAADQPFDAEKNIFRHGQVRRKIRLLVDHRNSCPDRCGRRRKRDSRSAQQNFAGIGRINSGQNFGQRRLPGAVFAAQGMDRAGTNGKRHVAQRFDRAEALRNMLHFKTVHDIRHFTTPMPPVRT